MRPPRLRPSSLLLALPLLASCAALGLDEPAPLPSWNDGPARRAIVDFVERTTDEDHPDFVPVNERVAVFDNDGTLWAEQPYYFQLAFAMDRVRALADEHPEWADTEPFRSALAGDVKGVFAGGEHALVELVLATHGDMTTEAFADEVADWLDTAFHPELGRPYTDLVYQPMLEVLEYLRANDYQTWIVSGGGIDFMRVFAEEVYGVPPEQVIGTQMELAFENTFDGPVMQRLPELHFIDDKEGKPVGIQRHIGRRPTAAFGNSDGDLAMLQWTMGGDGARLAAIVHHTDPAREWAYDRTSKIGRLDQALDEARRLRWTVVDMRKDWRLVFPPEPVPRSGD